MPNLKKKPEYRCLICGHDIDRAIFFDAFSGGESMPDGGTVLCENCGTEFEVRYEWKLILEKVTLVRGKTPTPEWLKGYVGGSE